MCPHTVALSTTTAGVTIAADDGTTIPISLPANGTTAALAIDIGGNATGWTATVSNPAGFLSASPASGTGDGTLTITYSANTSPFPRTARITLSTTGGTGTAITRTLSLTQAAGRECNLPTCFVGNIRLDSAEAITDAIKAYTHIDGNLTIGDGDAGTDIANADLQGLSVEEITGDLKIVSTKLTELNAFASLRSVGDSLIIGLNASLTSISGFGALTRAGAALLIGGFVRINGVFTRLGNPLLETVSGFGMLSSVGGDLYIRYNDALTSLPSFTSLRSVGRNLLIRNNAALTSVSGFASLSSVVGRLSISSNAALTSVSGFASLSSVVGRLSIGGDELTSVSGFGALRSVGGNLSIENNSEITSLPSFASLSSVGGGLQIRNNDVLTSLPSFASLSSVGRSLTIGSNDELTFLPAFSSLSSVGGWLVISGNAVLTSVSGFSSLSSVGGRLEISSNNALTSISDFASLSSVGRDLQIVNNAVLTSVSGFASLSSVGSVGSSVQERQLSIRGNASLTSLPSFPALSSVGGRLQISSNDELTSLPAFPALRSIGYGITITNNPMLSVCCGVFPFLQSPLPPGYTLGGSGTPSISGNKAGCNTIQQIRSGGVCHTISVSTTTTDVTISADDGSTIPISLPANGTSAAFTIDIGGGAAGWTATEASDPANFLSASPASGTGDGTLTITYSANTVATLRRATITLATTGSTGTPTTRTLSLTQAGSGPAMLRLRGGNVELGASPIVTVDSASGDTTLAVSVSGNATGWEIVSTVPSEGFALTASPNALSDSLVLRYDVNTGVARSAVITLRTTGGSGTAATEAITLSQAGAAPTISASPSSFSEPTNASGTVTTTITLGGGAESWSAAISNPDFIESINRRRQRQRTGRRM